MIDRIIEFSANNRVLVFALAAAACAGGWWSMRHTPLDAIPDLGDTQVIVYSRWDRSPDILEDQVTYPIISAMLGTPKVKAVRGLSDFGYSYVYVIFEDGTDIYWARSRTLEALSGVLPSLPQGVKSQLGPDATGLGWVFQYVLTAPPGKYGPEELRSVQDWYVRYHLKSVPGVAEVAPIGGFGIQYQVNVDPNRLQAYGVPIGRVVEAIRGGNSETGGRLVEFAGTEYMVRSRGYVKSPADLENAVVATSEDGAAIRVKDLGQVSLGPDIRRGTADLDGLGETVSGIVVMREGSNALDVIDRVKERIREIEPGLPAGVKILPVYDRSDLIRRSISNLKITLTEVIVTVMVVILLFLWHFPSAVIPMISIPVSVLSSFIFFRMLGVTANIMSLSGIAIAIGALVDAAIVVVEQAHKKLAVWEATGRKENQRDVILSAVKEVGGPSFFALLVIAVSFLPVLALEAEEGRLFKPLAYTKNLAMIVAAVVAITLDPALRLTFMHLEQVRLRWQWLSRAVNAVLVGKVRGEETHPLSRALHRIYAPVCDWSLRHRWAVIGGAVLMLAATVPVYRSLGAEFMPPLDEGSLMYMPSTMPGISIGEAQRVLRITDGVLKGFPEVDHVLGKAGRAETATDPAPLSMIETIITLKPRDRWRPGMTREKLVDEMNSALNVPGVTNAWTMPVKGRIDMLTTGVRTPVGLKVFGSSVEEIEKIGSRIEALLKPLPGTRSVFSERTGQGYFLDLEWNREELARFGLTVERAQDVVASAIGGENVTSTVEGRARYPVNVRYMRDFRSDTDALGRVLIPVDEGKKQIPLAELATVKISPGPAMLRDEDGMLTGYVYVDVSGRDLEGYVDEGKRVLGANLSLPPGYSIRWSGQYEAMERVRERLEMALPATLGLILLLLYLNTRSVTRTMIVLLAVPFSAIGAFWFLWLLGYNMSVAVWIGLIALLGVDAETGVFMLLYLDLACSEARRCGRMGSADELRSAIMAGAVQRIRPKFMTVATAFLGLVPIMWATGTGSDVMKRIAAPMIGGIFTSFLLELVVYPAIYEAWLWHSEVRQRAEERAEAPAPA